VPNRSAEMVIGIKKENQCLFVELKWKWNRREKSPVFIAQIKDWVHHLDALKYIGFIEVFAFLFVDSLQPALVHLFAVHQVSRSKITYREYSLFLAEESCSTSIPIYPCSQESSFSADFTFSFCFSWLFSSSFIASEMLYLNNNYYGRKPSYREAISKADMHMVRGLNIRQPLER
jgi:hypothetical protein